jgi:NAD+ synthase (glutamine-hydrolysing)
MTVRIALGQANAVVGDLEGNRQKALAFLDRARQEKADLLILPELFLCGYPPEDLLHRPRFLKDTKQSLLDLACQSREISLLTGWAESTDKGVYNSASLLQNGKVVSNYRKGRLPNYGVFDEKRYFLPGYEPVVIKVQETRWAVTICEDIWDLEWMDDFFLKIRGGFDGILNISASPFYVGKIHERQEALRRCALHFDCPLVYCNLIGGQDELIFDGRSMVIGADGRLLYQAAGFKEDLLYAEFEKKAGGKIGCTAPSGNVSGSSGDDVISEVWQALVLGTGDYVRKNGFSRVLIGLSGGIDSALTAAIAAEAMGPQNVVGVTMPSRFNSAETRSDAGQMAANLGIEFRTLPIGEVLDCFNRILGTVEGWTEKGIAYENLQARIRGTMLMSLSNQFGYLVLTTGNKSETAVGYSTLYGDTAGGFAVIKDVPKTMVYQLCDYYNRLKGRKIIPQSIIDRIPSAELRDNQKDSDSLPEYDLLDQILKRFVEEKLSRDELIGQGLPKDAVEKVCRLVDQNEYKRRQCPPGIKITPRAFGKDRRMPITNKYRG